MKKTLIGLIVASAMVAMSPVFADDYAYGYTAHTVPAYSVDTISKQPDHPLPAAHVVGAKALTPAVRPYSVSYIAVGTASTAIACAGEDDHYTSIVAGRPSKIPIAI